MGGFFLSGGERGIRTPGGLHLNGFQDRRNRPLCHLSEGKGNISKSRFKIILKNIVSCYTNCSFNPKFYCMSAVHKILDKKGKPLFTITPETSVYHAIETLAAHNIGALIVKDGDKFCGVFTERDYARKVVLQDRNSRETAVKEIIDNDAETVSSSASIKDCMTLMTANSIRYLPVVDDGKVLGIISIGDVVKYVIEEQAFALQQMENYINQ